MNASGVPAAKMIRQTIGHSILLLVVLVSCADTTKEFAEEFELLTMRGATNIERQKLDGYAAMQLNYTVDLDYPKMAIAESEFAQLEKRGWTACVGTRTHWDSHVDNRVKANPHCVHRFGKYFVKQNDLMLISLEYQSKVNEKFRCASKPDNSTQWVIVVVYEHKNRDSMGLDKLRLSCGK